MGRAADGTRLRHESCDIPSLRVVAGKHGHIALHPVKAMCPEPCWPFTRCSTPSSLRPCTPRLELREPVRDEHEIVDGCLLPRDHQEAPVIG